MLKHLRRVRIEFNAFDPRNRAAIEFLAQVGNPKVRDSNPKCEIIVKRRTDDAPPLVHVTFNNGAEEVMDGREMAAQHMRTRISEKAEIMETEQLFKEAGLTWPVEIPAEEVELYNQQQAQGKRSTSSSSPAGGWRRK
eukprot:TRINITY_DN29847_c0_g1_i1.p2 TRINITY_DN29847_c0_g1~~TRINITY_DN29847_c0_g1_i1.p2  ORF type:complete len:138 (+),score=28.67 TRINITY_DN29847_c0_g1_i1:350-763(+)